MSNDSANQNVVDLSAPIELINNPDIKISLIKNHGDGYISYRDYRWPREVHYSSISEIRNVSMVSDPYIYIVVNSYNGKILKVVKNETGNYQWNSVEFVIPNGIGDVCIFSKKEIEQFTTYVQKFPTLMYHVKTISDISDKVQRKLDICSLLKKCYDLSSISIEGEMVATTEKKLSDKHADSLSLL